MDIVSGYSVFRNNIVFTCTVIANVDTVSGVSITVNKIYNIIITCCVKTMTIKKYSSTVYYCVYCHPIDYLSRSNTNNSSYNDELTTTSSCMT